MDNLLVSFSGGRTSAYMTWRLLQERSYKNIVVTFANTGQEDVATLNFVNDCDNILGFNTVWLEALVDPVKGKSTKHTIVRYSSASRSGEPYESVIKKFGIPNKNQPHCTRELKQRPIESYRKSIEWSNKNSHMAIGIRADEIDRMSETAKSRGIVYPLVKWGIKKSDVLDFWSKQDFNLSIPEHLGNCTWCWKKII